MKISLVQLPIVECVSLEIFFRQYRAVFEIGGFLLYFLAAVDTESSPYSPLGMHAI